MLSLITKQVHISATGTTRSTRRLIKGKKRPEKFSLERHCRVEELEKREFLAADPISVGAVYVEQITEEVGDKFYIAWVGGDTSTDMTQVVINLDKNTNGVLDEGECFFDTVEGGRGVSKASPFAVYAKSENIQYTVQSILDGKVVDGVADGSTAIILSFTDFNAGDHFIFTVDVDEYQLDDGMTENPTTTVEGGEFGGSILEGISGSLITATFTSKNGETVFWNGMYLNDYDNPLETQRPESLSRAYSRDLLPYDADYTVNDLPQHGDYSAGIYGEVEIISLSGYVYGDTNTNCHYEVGTDNPLANIEVTLVSTDGKQAYKTYTDENGYYEFVGLGVTTYDIYCNIEEQHVKSESGKYYYDYCAQSEDGTPVTGTEIHITPRTDSYNNNFGKRLPGSISGYVYEDYNDNGIKEAGEAGIPGTPLSLYMKDPKTGEWGAIPIASTTTDETGYYKFDNLAVSRTYKVVETQPRGYSDGKMPLVILNWMNTVTRFRSVIWREMMSLPIFWSDTIRTDYCIILAS